MTLDILYTRGLPGSGKTYWAKAFLKKNPAYKRVNNDELRLMLDGEQFNEKNEDFIRSARSVLIKSALEAHKSVLVDNCNLSPKAVAELKALAKSYGATLTVQDFTGVPLADCIARDAWRASPVGAKVIRRMRDQFLRTAKPVYTPPFEGAPLAVIVDVDGTLALHGERNVYDFSRLDEDKLNLPVAHVVDGYWDAYEVIIVTAREEKFRDLTQQWLGRHAVRYDKLFMRSDGDKREDSIIKRELFDEHIKPFFNVRAVFDDRDRVVKMWRDLGLTVFQVQDGDF